MKMRLMAFNMNLIRQLRMKNKKKKIIFMELEKQNKNKKKKAGYNKINENVNFVFFIICN